MTEANSPIVWSGASHPGKQRSNNEDAYALIGDRACAIVADGMGGLEHGEIASGLVISTVIEALGAGRSVADGILGAHQRIVDESQRRGSERMGSTAVGIVVEQDQATISWVGDSRAYLWREGDLTTLTRDHSFVAQLVEAGAISADEADEHPHRHVLTRAVGIADAPALEVDVIEVRLRPGDRVLLCTDGLYGYLPETALCECLARTADVAALADELIAATLAQSEAGDNITVVCAEFHQPVTTSADV